MDMSDAVRFVDDYMDKNPKTRDSSPGTVNGHRLIHIGNQIQIRIFRRGKIKHLIFVEEGTRNIWYKDSMHSVGVVKMGFSQSRRGLHPKAVTMEKYAEYFLDGKDDSWLLQNNYRLIENERICRAVYNETKDVSFESASADGTTLDEIIKGDVKYGIMVPRNGKYFTYRAMDWNGRWISDDQIKRGITISWNKTEKVIDLEFREAKKGEYADFKIYFRNTADDPLLTKNTIMYHYYPISNYENPNRGVCVVNTDFPFSSTGDGILLHIFDPEHYPNPVTSSVKIMDFDAIYDHEGSGHGLGLPHSPNRNTKMFGNEGGMAESIFSEEPYETIPRLQAKYPKKIMKEHHRKRWIDYYNVRQDKY